MTSDLFNYTTQDISVTVNANEYIKNFRDPQKFIEFCKQCPNYGKLWSCPPFENDIYTRLSSFSKVTLFATVITPVNPGLPLCDVSKFFIPERRRIERLLLSLEKERNGLAMAFAGTCLYCPEGSCSRQSGLPCRHPNLVRPALEAYGFDVNRTAAELLNTPILWSKDNTIPHHLTLVCALFF